MRFPFLVLLFCLTAALAAQERFTDWRATIVPATDRSVEVTERISVVSTGDEIKRGITRTLPDHSNHPVEILSLTRDGRVSEYHTRRRGGNTTVYAGTKDELLSPGTYTYELRYTIGQAVRMDEGLDELQFEVIGPDVDFPVERAAATFVLPAGLGVAQYACYTGEDGSSSRNCTLAAPDSGRLNFTSTVPLGQGTQFSVAAGFEPGFFSAPVVAPPPTWFQREGSLLLWLGLLAAAMWYAYSTWRRHGVDPEGPRVGNVYGPPEGLSPASVGHLVAHFGEEATRGFTASILALATRGYLSIESEEDKGVFSTSYTYRLLATRPAPDPAGLPAEQRLVYDQLFEREDSYLLKGEYDKYLHELSGEHYKMVKERHRELRSEGANVRFIWPLIGIYLVSLAPAFYWAGSGGADYAMPLVLIYAIAGLIGVILYVWLIRRPSRELVALRTRIGALKEYLDTSEEKRKRLLNAPAMSREHYEELLPYAIALGINKTWSGYFEDLVSRDNYHPVWLVGAHGFTGQNFNSNFETAVGGSSTQPGGGASGGGGSVGGGVGGGGAGGW